MDAIKIDRSFVKEIGTENPNTEIAKTLLALSHSLTLDATAEGIAAPQQYWDLRSQDCLKSQGYLFSAPLSVGEVAAFSPRYPAQ
ncbi:EAL domain-containing protein [Acaryochloris sp. IP29b_bin.148]|uniref:EAL domain-containing protein n=1 Tax=Acaryochloris sp. IP29b_bin.148 TaxID=2969218 RepID=UPI00261E0A95|nr:EAL domain-containing protein [Acaryochloris sp. IP29b_bin.148]